MIRRWCKHPLDLRPGDPIVLEPHKVNGRCFGCLLAKEIPGGES